MSPWIWPLIAWGIAAVLMVAVWMLQRRIGDAGIVDVAWTYTVGLFGVAFAVLADGLPERRLAIGIIVALWSLRLGTHVLIRVMRHAEDGRYVTLKQQWGDAAQRKLAQFYQYQAFGAALFAIPMLAASLSDRPFGWHDIAAIVIAVVSWSGEAWADAQLARFKADPANRGQVCRVGWWRLSRHPNYFFEWLHWWVYVLFAWGTWLLPVALLGPIAMFWFIVFVTGIPPTERQSLASRGEAYRRYQQTTSPFFPWFPSQER